MLRCGQTGHLYRDCRHEPITATPGPPELPVYPKTREAIQSDSLVKRAVLYTPVLPVKFVPASVVSLGGFLPPRRRAKRKRARICEGAILALQMILVVSAVFLLYGNVDKWAVNDCDAGSSENGSGGTVNNIIGGVNTASNNTVGGDAGNSCAANHNTANINDDSRDRDNISGVISDNPHTSNVNSSKDDDSVFW